MLKEINITPESATKTKQEISKEKPKLSRIKEELLNNPNVFTAGIIEHNDKLGNKQTSDIIVAPIIPTIDVSKLNNFMNGLVKNIKPSSREQALNSINTDGGISLGRLTFEKTRLRVYPDVFSARTIYDYEQGIKNGTIEPKSYLDRLGDYFEGGQVTRIKKDRKLRKKRN